MFVDRAHALAASLPVLSATAPETWRIVKPILVYGIPGLVLLTVLLFLVFRPAGRPNYRKQLRSGVPAAATVVKVGDPEIREDGTQVLLLLEVRPAGDEPYKTTLECTVPPGAVPQTGQSLAVEFDPRDPRRVILAREANPWRTPTA
jgi:hypothetical protein